MADIGRQRLAAQGIARSGFETPRDAVAWLGAVQAQDWNASKWAVGLRTSGATDASIEAALDAGEIVRVHAMRHTWQLVAREDVRWMVSLVGPRVLARAGRRHANLGLDARTIRRAVATMARAVEGAHLTRAELAKALARAKIAAEGQRLAHLLGIAELEGILCSGARRGKQHTWALVDERVPSSKTVDRSEALADLARRYFQSRGPATANDFRWWSGLEARDVRAAIEASDLERVVERSRTLFSIAPCAPRSSGAWLLPAFDEFLVAYEDRTDVLDPRHARRTNDGGGFLAPVVVHGGRVAGTWRREGVTVRHEWFERPSPEMRRAIDRATARYERFLALR